MGYVLAHISQKERSKLLDQKELVAYHCTTEWHLARMSPSAALIYPFALHISKKHGRFFCSAANMAQYFGRSRATIERGLKDLAESGFFVTISKQCFKSSIYEVLTHKPWAKTYPGLCAEKLEFPWSGESGDMLGQAIWAKSGGMLTVQPFQLAMIRKSGLSDEIITSRFEEFLADKLPVGKEWKYVIQQFSKSLPVM